MLRPILTRWRNWLASRKRASTRFVAIIYFDGPRTKFSRARILWNFEEHSGGLRIPLENHLCGFMPEPHPDETICRREFASAAVAKGWIKGRLSGFDHEKIVGELRTL